MNRRSVHSKAHESAHETALRGMDPATGARTDTWDDLPDRARGDLDAILATTCDPGPIAAPTATAALGGGRTRRTRRALLAVAAALLAGGLAVPVVTAPAYAGWEQVPQAVDAAGTEAAASECREFWSRSGVGATSEPAGFPEASELRAVVSERRGPFTFTVLRGPQGQFADCLLQASGWRGLLSGGGAGAGSMTPIPPVAQPGPDAIDTAMLGAVGPSRRTVFGIPMPRDSRARSYAYGRVGAQVTGVVLHTRAQSDLVASVQNGLWAAWWPSAGDDPEVNGIRATITLRDGNTREVSLDAASIPWSQGR